MREFEKVYNIPEHLRGHIRKIVDNNYEEIYDTRDYEQFLLKNLTDYDIAYFAENDLNIYDVDRWVLLNQYFYHMSFEDAMKLTNAFYELDIEISECLEFKENYDINGLV